MPTPELLQDDAHPLPESFPALWRHLVGKFASELAIADSHRSLSYSELDERSAAAARALLAAGASKGTRVGILMPNSATYLSALFGVLRIGAVGVLISTLARPAELAQQVRAADVDILLSVDAYLNNDYVAMLEAAFPSLTGSDPKERLFEERAPFLRAIWIWGKQRPGWATDGAARMEIGPMLSASLLAAAEGEVVPSDPAVTIFTSGSSAEPKAVVHGHRGLVRQGLALSDLMGGCGRGDRIATVMPFFWVGGLCTVVLAALCSGTAVLCPETPSMVATLRCLREQGATHIMHWPQQLDLMRDDPEFRSILARLRPAYAHQLELFGQVPPGENPNSLGMTETLGPHSMMPFGPLPAGKVGSFGLAVGGIERIVVDPSTGDTLPPGEFGQLRVRGGASLIGMHRKSSREVFDERGFYPTDDVAMIDEDGHLFFSGRGGDIVKVSGANVSPVEVEGVLCGLEGIKAACVVGLPNGKHDVVLVAAIVSEDGILIGDGSLRDQLRSLLSSYKVPRHFVFLDQSELPLTATGKIYRPALKDLLSERLAAAA